MILDRTSTDYDELWRGLDFSVIECNAPKPSSVVVEDSKEFLTTTTTVSSEHLLDIFASNNNSAQTWASNNQVLSSGGGGSSDSVVCGDVKQEIVERTASENQANCDQDDMFDFLQEVRRDWFVYTLRFCCLSFRRNRCSN